MATVAGTTIDEMASGSLNFCYVVAIEGYEHLVTNHPDRQAVVDAWAGTDWESTEAIGGLFVQLDREQSFHPLNAFMPGGKVTLRVAPGEPDDTFGVDLAATARGEYTYLRDEIGCDDTTIPVKDASMLPASGTVHIGVECIEYSGKTSTTLTGCTRGKFSPFLTDDGNRFGRIHRAGFVSAYNTPIDPVVSQYRRGSWVGALVGVWVHKVENGVLNSRDDARLVFAGTIAETRDDGETGHAAIEVVDILDRVKETSLVRDQFRAHISDGIFLSAEDGFGAKNFKFTDTYLNPTPNTSSAIDLTIVSTPPASAYEIAEGFYTIETLANAINAWLAQAKADAGISGTYNLISPWGPAADGTYRTHMVWINENGDQASWKLELPHRVAAFLGIIEKFDPNVSGTHSSFDDSDNSGDWHSEFSDFAPLRWYIPDYITGGRLLLTDVEGEVWDNAAWMPYKVSVPPYPGNPTGEETIGTLDSDVGKWAMFMVGGKPFIVGAIDDTDPAEVMIVSPRRFFNHDDLNVRYDGTENPPRIEVVQIYALYSYWKSIVKAIFYSTGTAGFNHATHDQLPQALSVGIPGEMLGAAFDASVDNAPEGSELVTWIIEKPLKLEALVNVDLVLRGMHLVWKDEGLIFRQWESPVTANAVAQLTEANKALPAEQRGSHRSPSVQSTEWLRPVVKIMFSREWTSDTYQDGPLVLEDRTSIGDMGNLAPVHTLEARNLSKDQVAAIAELFLARFPNISRPAYRSRRTIGLPLFEALSPGDTIALTDGFTRDPVTGERGVTQQPAIVVGVHYSLGGPTPANPKAVEPMFGEVDIVMYPDARFATYAPSMAVDETANAGGYTAGYNGALGIKVKAHEHTESSEAADATHFAAGDEVEIIETDPVDPTAPLYWEREIDAVSGNDLTIDSALSAPSFDTARRYTIRSRTYSAAEATQRAHVYQADEATARIEATANAYHYAGAVAPAAFTSEDEAAPSQLVAELAYGDGRARDVHHERAILRTLNNIIDHKAARNSPTLRGGSSALPGGGSTWRMIAFSDKYVGRLEPNPNVQRRLSIAPRFRSSSGASASVRITVCRTLPTGDTYDDVIFAPPYDQFTWTTSSTTWQDGAAHDFDAACAGASGIVVIVIEATSAAECRGPSKCRQGARIEF